MPSPLKAARPPIAMQPVQSSNIEAVGYDSPHSTLIVRFKSGGTYHYPNVTAEEHQAFLAADSPGQHFHANLRARGGVKQ